MARGGLAAGRRLGTRARRRHRDAAAAATIAHDTRDAEKLAAATALFGTATAPFVYKSVDIWRTVHPKTTVIPTLKREMAAPFAFSAIAFVLLSVLVLTLRVHLAKRQAALDALYLAAEE